MQMRIDVQLGKHVKVKVTVPVILVLFVLSQLV